jgi:hypothetical protein
MAINVISHGPAIKHAGTCRAFFGTMGAVRPHCHSRQAQTVKSSSEPLGIVRGGGDPGAAAVFGGGAAGGVAEGVLSDRTGCARPAGLIGAAAVATPASVVGDNMPPILPTNG